jgi:hypothetical protein
MSQGRLNPAIADALVTGSVSLNKSFSHRHQKFRNGSHDSRMNSFPTCEQCGRPSVKSTCKKCEDEEYDFD